MSSSLVRHGPTFAHPRRSPTRTATSPALSTATPPSGRSAHLESGSPGRSAVGVGAGAGAGAGAATTRPSASTCVPLRSRSARKRSGPPPSKPSATRRAEISGPRAGSARHVSVQGRAQAVCPSARPAPPARPAHEEGRARPVAAVHHRADRQAAPVVGADPVADPPLVGDRRRALALRRLVALRGERLAQSLLGRMPLRVQAKPDQNRARVHPRDFRARDRPIPDRDATARDARVPPPARAPHEQIRPPAVAGVDRRPRRR